jgi:hypothetical protein
VRTRCLPGPAELLRGRPSSARHVPQQQRCGNFLLAVLKYPDVIYDAQQNYDDRQKIDYCQTAPFDIDS